jgi:hypothetical protein
MTAGNAYIIKIKRKKSKFDLIILKSCYDGFTGALCQIEIDECRSAPCQNGGTCIQPYPNLYTCLCTDKYEGPQCSILIDSCIGNSCRNGATCSPNPFLNTYTCICSQGTTGTYCENSVNICSSNPCGNTGVCVQSKFNSYQW